MKENVGQSRGAAFVVLSAVIFGVMPVFAKITYEGGSNGISLTFYRAALALPLLWFLGKKRSPGGMGLSKWQLLPLLLSGTLMSATTLLLYVSYAYIPISIATTLHFVYPLVVAGLCALLYRARLRPMGILGLLLGCGGISLFLPGQEPGGFQGMLLALLSGVTYGGYIISLGRPTLAQMPTFKLSFYLSLVASAVAGGFGLATGQLVFQMTPAAWVITLFTALGITVGACVLFQLGVRRAGPTTASMLSLFEPITSVLCGVLFLSDRLSAAKIIGCLLILAGLVCTLWKRKGAPARGG